MSTTSTISILFLSSLSLASASPLYIIKPSSIMKRSLTTGTKAGLGVGIAVVVILVVLIVTFFTIHFRHKVARKNVNGVYDSEKYVPGAIPANTHKHGSRISTTGEPGPQISTMPRRQKSVKDRLMGPLYRGSTYDMINMPNKAKLAGQDNRASQMTMDDPSFLQKPWSSREDLSNRASYSSKRATRMMMMM